MKNTFYSHIVETLFDNLLFFAHSKTKGGSTDAADNVHEVSYIILDKEDAVYLLAQVQHTDQDESNGDTAILAAGKT